MVFKAAESLEVLCFRKPCAPTRAKSHPDPRSQGKVGSCSVDLGMESTSHGNCYRAGEILYREPRALEGREQREGSSKTFIS